jgi:hypothetical protein
MEGGRPVARGDSLESGVCARQRLEAVDARRRQYAACGQVELALVGSDVDDRSGRSEPERHVVLDPRGDSVA